MSDKITDVTDDIGRIEEAAPVVQGFVSDSGAEVKRIRGSICLIKDAEKLGPVAYAAADAGLEAFRLYDQENPYLDDHLFLAGRVTRRSPDHLYALWFCQNDNFYFKWVQADWEAMQEMIQKEREEFRYRLYRAACRQNFLKLLKKIELETKV